MKKHTADGDVYILAIESSCDETAAAVVKNGRQVLSNVISSQIALHTLYGGVVPEIASRKHIEKINQVIESALKEADMTLEEITAIAVTYDPGLVGALLVGVAEAKALAYAAGKPLVGVHHIEGHVSANFIENEDLEPPFVCLIVSGGHTHLVIVKDYGEFEIIGRTRDDAAGEAFDKVAREMCIRDSSECADLSELLPQVYRKRKSLARGCGVYMSLSSRGRLPWFGAAGEDKVCGCRPKARFSPGQKTQPKPHPTGHGPFRTRPPHL